jgi:hypothetical protein
MMAAENLASPTGTEMQLVGDGSPSKENSRVQMKKQLGLLEGVAIILGIIFGSGNYFIDGLLQTFDS